MVIVVSLPITSAQAMATASGMTGFTFPGIMLLPGWSASNSISDKPVNGPLFIHLKSLEIFISTTLRFLTAEESSTALSTELKP